VTHKETRVRRIVGVYKQEFTFDDDTGLCMGGGNEK
jgi:hypothetical protein